MIDELWRWKLFTADMMVAIMEVFMLMSCLQMWLARRYDKRATKVFVQKRPTSGMEAVVIHSESPSRLET
jgi:hypothetical protein